MRSNSIIIPGIGGLGNTYAFRRNGKQFFAVKPIRNASKTEAQVNQRSRFTFAAHFGSKLKEYIRVGWVSEAHGYTPYNAFIKHFMKECVTGSYPEWEVDFDNLLVSEGNVPQFAGLSASMGTSGLVIKWSDECILVGANADDVMMPIAYDNDKGEWLILNGVATRKESSYTLKFPSHWSGDEVVVFVGFASADGKSSGRSVLCGRFSA